MTARVHAVALNDVPALADGLEAGRLVEANAARIPRHLYVYDGDLSRQDTEAAHIGADRQHVDGLLTGVARDTASDAELTAAVSELRALHGRFNSAATEAVARSRAETVREAEDRSGSRDLYIRQVVPTLDATLDQVTLVSGKLRKRVATEQRHATATVATARRMLAVVSLLTVPLAIGLAYVVTRSVTRPVQQIVTSLELLRDGCIGGLLGALQAMARGDLTCDVDAGFEKLDMQRRDELGTLAEAADEIGTRTTESSDAYRATRAALMIMIGDIGTTSATVSAASIQMASASGEAGRAVAEIAEAASDVARGAERQVRAVERARSLTDEMVIAADVSARTAADTVGAARKASDVAGSGADAVATESEAMQVDRVPDRRHAVADATSGGRRSGRRRTRRRRCRDG